jgi:hypothetical protein
MRPKALLLLPLCAWLGNAAWAAPEVMTAADLRQLCADADHVSVNVCRVYILGVAQGISLGVGLADGTVKGARPCIPDSIPAERLEETLRTRLVEQLEAHPAHGTQDAAAVLARLAATAFACAKGAH